MLVSMVHTGREHLHYGCLPKTTYSGLNLQIMSKTVILHYTPNPNNANMKAIYRYLRMKASSSEIAVNMFRTETAIYNAWA